MEPIEEMAADVGEDELNRSRGKSPAAADTDELNQLMEEVLAAVDTDQQTLPAAADAGAPKRKCFVCDDVTVKRRSLTHHMKCHNPAGRPFQCLVCEEWYFKTEAAMQQHYYYYYHHIPGETNPIKRRSEQNRATYAKKKEEKEKGREDEQQPDKSAESKRVKRESTAVDRSPNAGPSGIGSRSLEQDEEVVVVGKKPPQLTKLLSPSPHQPKQPVSFDQYRRSPTAPFKYRRITQLSTDTGDFGGMPNSSQYIVGPPASSRAPAIKTPTVEPRDASVSLRQALAETKRSLAKAQASNADLRHSLATADQFRGFVENELEKTKVALKKVADEFDEYKKKHDHEQHLLERLKGLSPKAEHQKGEEFGAKMQRFEEELEGLLNTNRQPQSSGEVAASVDPTQNGQKKAEIT